MRVLAIAWAIAAGFLAVQAIIILNKIEIEQRDQVAAIDCEVMR